MMQSEIVAVLGIFAGVAIRAIAPFLKKRLEASKHGQAFKWKAEYSITIILTLVLAIPTAMFVLMQFPIPETLIFPAGFMAGWSSQDIVNKVIT